MDEQPRTTEPSDRTDEFERADASQHAGADRMPTPEEEAAAERQPPPSEEAAEHYREMTDRGKNQKGEGRVP
jgi:hypothetical protein